MVILAAADIVAAPVPHQPYERLVSREDYPAAAREQGLAGTTRVRLDVLPTGRVSACTVLASSGAAALDAATCRLLSSRARFTPARDSNGNPAAGSVEAELTWSPTG
jgi:protein TonB